MFTKTRQALIEHYAKMALTKGWLDHARLRAKELEACQSGLWLGIGLQIKQRMDELKEKHE